MKGSSFHSSLVNSVREIVFGLEDSLVSTLGAVTGIAAGTNDHYVVILSGLVLVSVEAVSMAAGSYLSTKATQEVNADTLRHTTKKQRRHLVVFGDENPVKAAAVMMFFYVLGGMVPLTPYLLLPIQVAYAPSILLTVFVLFLVGAWKATIAERSIWKSGLEMVSVSLVAAIIGFLIGRLAASWFGVAVA